MNKRIAWADALKGWLMLTVILGHSLGLSLPSRWDELHLCNLLCSFYMPAFIAVSGWLCYRESDKHVQLSVLFKRFRQLVIPYFVWSLMAFFIRRGSFYDIILHPDSYFWFLWVLFFINVLFVLSKKIGECIHVDELLIASVVCIVLMLVMIGLDLRILGFQFIAYYYFYYLIGYCMHRFERSLSFFRKRIILLMLALGWLFLAWHWRMHELPAWVPVIQGIPVEVHIYIYRIVTAICAIIVLIFVSPKFMNTDSFLNRTMSKFGQLTLGIYVCHILVMGQLVKLLNLVYPNIALWLSATILFVVSTILSYVIVLLLSQNKITLRILLGKV